MLELYAVEDIKKRLAAFRTCLRDASDPERAEKGKAYLKSPFRFFGNKVPFIGDMAKKFRRTNKEASRKYVFALAERLWGSEYHEEKILSVKLLEQYPQYLDMDAMPVLENMLSESTGWDHVDGISIYLVGEVLKKDKAAYAYLKKWKRSNNFWMRRASMISQILLFRKGEGNRKLFFKFAEEMIEEREFFIRKAIGWTLREMTKANPDEVFDFLMTVKDRASGLTLREGSKRLSQKRIAKVLRI
jgi:3-methyladenine DNA glycosylase AlkD